MALSYKQLKRVLIGKPFPTRADVHERLDKVRALAIFASDPISSNAYATEAIMSVLILISVSALQFTMPIALGVATLVIFVVISYIQTILHYPDGGGAYIVSKDNLGVAPSLFAGAALLIDYVLTVAVSVSAGIRALTSAFPSWQPYALPLALLAILLLTWINLRGVRESGTVFAFPTYAFVGGVILTILIGLGRHIGLWGAPLPVHELAGEPNTQISQALLIWLLVRAFAAGCTALTGIEAISNGVQAFKKPESKNAAETMVFMGVIAMTLFIGITFLASTMHLEPAHEGGESILSQMTRAVAGTGLLYYWVQTFTMLILVLAANTGYQDFPRLSSYLAKDGFLPRWMQNRGDRLVYNAGIVILAVLAGIVVLIFRADEIRMLPLYALGVMLSFTLSQMGMFRLMGRIAHLKPGQTYKTLCTTIHYESGVWWKRGMNAIGAMVTGMVLIALIVTKFTEGAWAVVLALPLLAYMFRSIKGHYATVAKTLTTEQFDHGDLPSIGDVVLVPLADVHRGTLLAMEYAKRLSNHVRAVSIITSPEALVNLQRKWEQFPSITSGVQLIPLDYEYRDLLTPLVDYILKVHKEEYPGMITTVVIPEFVPDSPVLGMMHNQTARLLRARLRREEGIVLIDVPFQIHG